MGKMHYSAWPATQAEPERDAEVVARKLPDTVRRALEHAISSGEEVLWHTLEARVEFLPDFLSYRAIAKVMSR